MAFTLDAAPVYFHHSMFPLLFEIPIFGGVRIYTYGVLYAVGVLTAITLTVREAKRVGVPANFILDLCFYIIIGNLVGARLLYIITDWQRYKTNPLDILKIWEGGLVFFGGLIGAILVALYFIRKHGYRFFEIADLCMPGVTLGHGIGRLGCFAAGCCYGREMPGFPLALTFPADPHTLAPVAIPLFPSQLAEAAVLFLIAGVLLFILRRKRFDGQVLLVYLVLYSIVRGILEIYRGDSIRGFIVGDWLSTSQFIGVCLVVAAIALYVRLRKRRKIA